MKMFEKLNDIFKILMTGGDPRTFPYSFTEPWIPLNIFFIYLFLVKYVGPNFMKNRKPFQLKKVLIFYNFIQVIFSAYMFVLISKEGWWNLRNWVQCKSIEKETTPTFMASLYIHHVYYLGKYTELFDTLFFILRKKYNQVSFLHVYHHGTMPFFTLLTFRFGPGSSISFVGFLNTFVHIIMYGYYLLAALGPEIQKYLWWKKYLTSLQLIQFIILFFHFLLASFNSTCGMPKALSIFMVSNIAFNFILFYFFYKREYKKKIQNKKYESNGETCELKINKNKLKYINGNYIQLEKSTFAKETTETEISYKHRRI